MSVWLTIPSARPGAEIAARLQRWKDQGYRIALWRNGPHVKDPVPADHLIRTEKYAGWARSINLLIKEVMVLDPGAEWFVGGGDDTDPDPTKRAEEIAAECSDHFYGEVLDLWEALPSAERGTPEADHLGKARTFGVMQPTGDRFGENEPWARVAFPDAPAYIDRICGSPWIGREFARRMNGGQGPLWPECYHMFSDQICKEVSQMLGVLWQRRDLTHFHDHPRRDGSPRTPDFAAASGIYGTEEWNQSKAIYERLKANNFSECMPIP